MATLCKKCGRKPSKRIITPRRRDPRSGRMIYAGPGKKFCFMVCDCDCER